MYIFFYGTYYKSNCFLEDLTDYPNRVNGTLAPYGAAASIEFLPTETIDALRHYYFDLHLWHGLFGFPDAYNLNLDQLLSEEGEVLDPEQVDPTMAQFLQDFEGPWLNTTHFSIDQGPIVLALVNYLHDGMVREWVATSPDVGRALAQAFDGPLPPEPPEEECDDGNPCTDDSRDPTSGMCVFTSNGAACNDGDACTIGDV